MIYALADKIKMDCEATVRDYNRGIISIEFRDGVLASSHVYLSDIEEMWDIDLSEYYIEY